MDIGEYQLGRSLSHLSWSVFYMEPSSGLRMFEEYPHCLPWQIVSTRPYVRVRDQKATRVEHQRGKTKGPVRCWSPQATIPRIVG